MVVYGNNAVAVSNFWFQMYCEEISRWRNRQTWLLCCAALAQPRHLRRRYSRVVTQAPRPSHHICGAGLQPHQAQAGRLLAFQFASNAIVPANLINPPVRNIAGKFIGQRRPRQRKDACTLWNLLARVPQNSMESFISRVLAVVQHKHSIGAQPDK